MWGLTPARLSILAVGVLIAFGAGTSTGWSLRSADVREATAKGQAALNALRADHATARADLERQARLDLEDEQRKFREADRVHQEELAKLRAAADARPPRLVRVPCPTGATASGAGGDPAGAAGQRDGAAPDRRGVGPDAGGGYRDVDVSGFERILDRAKAVSSTLRLCQAGGP